LFCCRKLYKLFWLIFPDNFPDISPDINAVLEVEFILSTNGLSFQGENMSSHREHIFPYSEGMTDEIEAQWFFGRYIERLLGKKQWNRSKLATEAKISTGHVSWLINGRTAGKNGPPEIGIEILIKLSRALQVSIDQLADAYQNIDPEQQVEKYEQAHTEALFKAILENIPRKMILEYAVRHLSPDVKKRAIKALTES
jgi:transcriptional regulator with XRE-family HTH domain